jgi:TnpA family transposase
MRLTNSSSDPLASALLDAGRIIKSTFLLRWMRDPDFRRPLNAQLNKCEARQDLTRNINFASGSGLRSADPTDLMNRTSVLALACNIIVALNTSRVGDLLADMKVEKSLSADIDLSSISPLMHEHIIRTGTYRFRQKENQDAYTN